MHDFLTFWRKMGLCLYVVTKLFGGEGSGRSLKMPNISLGKITTVALVFSFPSFGFLRIPLPVFMEGSWSDSLSCILNLLEGKKGGGRREAWACVIGSSCNGLFPLTAFPEELHLRRSKTSPKLTCAFSALSPGLPHPVHFWIFSSTCFISLTLDGNSLNYT